MKSMVRILVIDDCSLVVTALQHALNSAGYKVIATASSHQAIAILRRERIDLVITDINMPDPDGIELLRFARQEKLTMPFIVISGNESPLKMFRTARLLGAIFTLQKPLTTELLIESVEAALDRKYGSDISKSSN
jgi:DNA-binding NtrC family response regulator